MEDARNFLLDRISAGDRNFDGQVIAGFNGSGHYCLPSCRAGDPKSEGLQFFKTEQEARLAGLKPCRQCRPDRFYRDYDPIQAKIEALAGRVRREPGGFSDEGMLAHVAGLGLAELRKGFLEHFHTSPEAFLERARVTAAATLIEEGCTPAEAATEVGYPRTEDLRTPFQARMGLTPLAHAKVGNYNAFQLQLPPDFLLPQTLAYLGRDPKAPDLMVRGSEMRIAVPGDAGPSIIGVKLKTGAAQVACLGNRALPPGEMYALRERIARMLGLGSDPTAFEARAEHEPRIARLVEARRGLRIPQTPNVFEGLVWAIIGQQIHLGFAYQLRGRLIRLAGVAGDQGLISHPTPQRIALLEEADLTQRQFSRGKARYLIGLARAAAQGDLDLEALRYQPVGRIYKALTALHGIGEWSARYVMMRSLELADCAPLGDAGLVNALRAFHGLQKRPDRALTERLMLPFAPHRSLAAHHLWQTLTGSPKIPS